MTAYAEFDELGRVKQINQQTGGQTYSFSYTYNLAGAMTSETYPSGRMVSTSYDGVNRAQGVSGTPTPDAVYGRHSDHVCSAWSDANASSEQWVDRVVELQQSAAADFGRQQTVEPAGAHHTRPIFLRFTKSLFAWKAAFSQSS